MRGHKIYFDTKWRYADNNQIADDSRPCLRCKEYPTKEGHDNCLGTLKNVKHACCGHGVIKEYRI